jgi:hypothetical protein
MAQIYLRYYLIGSKEGTVVLPKLKKSMAQIYLRYYLIGSKEGIVPLPISIFRIIYMVIYNCVKVELWKNIVIWLFLSASSQ